VDNYNRIGVGLRYLLCGEPGTGKTKCVRSIINSCYENTTIIVVKGRADFIELFKFARLFTPVIICIDDLDLLVGNRNDVFNNSTLGSFLQELDGLQKNELFLLCTTNDKSLIDKAASRPGRFDLLLDFNKLRKENYIDIIKSNCTDDNIINLFDEKILESLRNKKVTGAFLTNLLKQLNTKTIIEPEADLKSYLKDLISLSYRGFYKKQEEKDNDFGFSSAYSGNGVETIDI
jgi:SpoVK/Ycf46/Vps4 family AAA+-type ATPase